MVLATVVEEVRVERQVLGVGDRGGEVLGPVEEAESGQVPREVPPPARQRQAPENRGAEDQAQKQGPNRHLGTKENVTLFFSAVLSDVNSE